MTYRYLIIFMLLVQSPIIFSQSLSGIKALDIPQNYILPNGNYIYKGNVKKLSGNIWEVFSDRSYNKTTSKAGGGDIFKVLQYLERFYVMEVNKNQLHIIKDSAINNDGTFSKYAIDFGWISIDNLLVWRHCLIDSQGLNKKVFIFKNEFSENYFNSPEINKTNVSEYFQVLYVFKEKKDKSLLSKSIRLYGDNKTIDKSIVGWVSNEIFIYFTSSVFAEPRTSITDSSNLLNPIFFEKRHAKKVNSNIDFNSSKILWSRSNNAEYESTIFRYPITNIKEDIAEVLVYYPRKPYQTGFYNKELVTANIFHKGYCNLLNSQHGLSYERVLLLNKVELVELLNIYDILLSSNDSLTIANEFRVHFKISNEITNYMLLESRVGSLIEKQFGFSNDNELNNKSVRDLIALKRDNSNGYIETIKEKREIIELLLNNKQSNRSFHSNGNQYYWIQCSCLP